MTGSPFLESTVATDSPADSAKDSATQGPQKPILIIGAGMAGFAVARELKQRGNTREVVMLTASHGGFYAKPLLSHGLSRSKPAASLLMPAEKAGAANRVRIVANTRVERVDVKTRTVHCGDGHTLEYSHLVVATGAQPLNFWGGERIFSVNSAVDMSRLEPELARARQVLVAGAGFVGLEFANDWAKAGKQVTVVSLAGPLSPLVPEEVSAWVQSRLAAAGIRFIQGKLAASVEGEQVLAQVENGSADAAVQSSNPLAFDLMLSAVGLGADVALWSQAGLQCTRHGVRVNERFQTSEPDVFALGDVMDYQGRPWRFVAPLNHAAKVIASNLCGVDATENFGAMGISLKCPDAPLALVLPSPTQEGSWVLDRADEELEARFLNGNQMHGYILGGAATSRRKHFDEML